MVKKLKLIALGVFGAFMISGPLQSAGVLPETTIGNASKTAIKTALTMGVGEAWGRCGGGISGTKGNNGWGNGGNDLAPGNSLHGNNSQTQSKRADRDR